MQFKNNVSLNNPLGKGGNKVMSCRCGGIGGGRQLEIVLCQVLWSILQKRQNPRRTIDDEYSMNIEY